MVIDIFRAFDAADIEYCVLRNFGGLCEGEIDGDVDVLIPSESRTAVASVFENGGWRKHPGDTSLQTRYKKYSRQVRDFVTFDIYWDAATYNGIEIVDGKRVLRNRTRYESFWIPSNEDYFVELVFHSVLNKNRVRESYRNELDRLTDQLDANEVRNHAESLFGAVGARAIDIALSGSFGELPSLKWKLVLAGLVRSPSRVPVFLWNIIILRELTRPIRSAFNRKNPIGNTPVVAVIGPDGVGKSTAVRGTVETISQNDIRSSSPRMGVHSGGTSTLKWIRSIYNRLTGWEAQQAAKESGTASLSSKSSELKALVLIADFALRYVRTQVSNDDVIVADRYVHELVVYAHTDTVERLFGLFEPNEFYGVILTGDIDEVADRSEFDRESVQEFYRRLEKINWHRIDASEGAESTIRTVSLIARAIADD